MTSSTPKSNTTHEQQQMRRECDANAACNAVSLAVHLLDRAGWNDLAWRMLDIQCATIRRRNAELEQV